MALPQFIQVALTDMLTQYGTAAEYSDIRTFAEDNDYDVDVLWKAYKTAALKLRPYIGKVVDAVSGEGV